MFTTSNHVYLYIAFGLYTFAWASTLIRLSRISFTLLSSGIIIHGLYLLGRGWLGGVFIANPIVEGPFFLPFCLAVIAFLSSIKHAAVKLKFLLLPVIFFTFLSIIYAKGMIPPTPKKLSIWAILFFISESGAHACFYFGAVFGVLSLLEMKTAYDFRSFVIWGIIIYTISQVTGAVWSYLGWGNTFNWSPRHLSSASIWLLYLAILHMKFISGWGVKREAILSVFAALYVFFISYGHYVKEMNFPRIGG